jgi:hypothetical protein
LTNGEESLTERQRPAGSSKLLDVPVPETENFMHRPFQGLHAAGDRKIDVLDQAKKKNRRVDMFVWIFGEL